MLAEIEVTLVSDIKNLILNDISQYLLHAYGLWLRKSRAIFLAFSFPRRSSELFDSWDAWKMIEILLEETSDCL